MKFQHLRHATHQLVYNGKTLLVDPVFSAPGAIPPIPGAPNTSANPLTELPVAPDILCKSDITLVTHLHQDHFDPAAAALLPKHMPLVCSPHHGSALELKGFEHVMQVAETLTVSGIQITLTGGTHGTGASAMALNPVYGFILKAPGEPTVYITGDTVWCPEMVQVLAVHQPDCIVCYGGAALYAGDMITMGIEDFEHIHAACPEASLIIIHTEGWNHCGLKRDEVRRWVEDAGMERYVWVPEDCEIAEIGKKID